MADCVILGYVGANAVDATLLNTSIPLLWIGRIAHALLFRVLPGDHAARREVRETQPAARQHRQLGAEQRAASFGDGVMIATRFVFAMVVAAVASAPASAQEAVASAVKTAPAPAAHAVEVEQLPPRDGNFSFEGPFGTFDRAALQRGFQVYKDVCSACHALKHIAFRNLADEGGPGLTADQVRALAASYRVPAGPNEQGQTVDANGQSVDAARDARRITCRRPFRTNRRPARPTTAPCRPIFRSLRKRASAAPTISIRS